MEQLTGTRPDVAELPVHPSLSGLVHLRPGTSWVARSATPAMLLMAGPSSKGAWSAVIGLPQFGLEAAAAAGVELSRTVLVPDPGEDWLTVVAALAEVVGVVVVRPPARVSERAAATVAAKLHRAQGLLISVGSPWPRAEAEVGLGDVRWSGLGRGYGHLQGRRATIEVVTRGRAARRQVDQAVG